MRKAVVAPGGVDHCCLRSNRRMQMVHSVGEHQFASGQADRAVESAAASQHNDFTFQAGGVGQLPYVFCIGAGDAGRGRYRHRARRTRGHHSRFGSGKLRKAFTHSALQFKHIDKMLRCILHCSLHLREFQRTTQIRPRPSRINKGPNPQAGIHIGGRRFSCAGGHGVGKTARANGGKERSCCQQFKERSAIVILRSRFRQQSAPFRMQQRKPEMWSSLSGTGGGGGIERRRSAESPAFPQGWR